MDGGALMNQSVHGLDLLTVADGFPVRRAKTGLIARRAHRMEAEDSAVRCWNCSPAHSVSSKEPPIPLHRQKRK
jgi:hypothetical protein